MTIRDRHIGRLKIISSHWGIKLTIKRTEIQKGFNVMGYFFIEENIPIIRMVYLPQCTLEELLHTYFHELGHFFIRNFYCLNISVQPKDIEEEKMAERWAYKLYKIYFPNTCPHHGSFKYWKYHEKEAGSLRLTPKLVDDILEI